jgi:hypothetical protein
MIVSIYIWVLSGLLGIVNFLFWGRIKRIEKDIEETKSKSSSIEKNYLNRFEEIHQKLNEVEKNIIKEIYDIKLLAIRGQKSENRVQKSENRNQ